MLGKIVRLTRSVMYDYPVIHEEVTGDGRFGKLKIALLTDYLTAVNLSMECRIRNLTPTNFREVLTEWKPDLVFVESAFHGYQWKWSYRLVKHSVLFGSNDLSEFSALIRLANELHIPTVFWNKDDGAYFEPFIEVAKKCDFIYTTDKNCVPKYQERVAQISPSGKCDRHVSVMQIAYQPRIHNFTGFNFKKNRMCFVGSYYRKILNSRRMFLDAVFDVCNRKSLMLDAYDRNSTRLSGYFEFRFPKSEFINVYPSLSNPQTAEIYKEYNVCLNVNSVTDSETMYSRRLIEILACGGIMVTNSSKAVESHFKDFCTAVSSPDELMDILPAMVAEPSKQNMEKAEAGSIYVKNNHSWERRLEQMSEDIKF